jgi:hypothetical protein
MRHAFSRDNLLHYQPDVPKTQHLPRPDRMRSTEARLALPYAAIGLPDQVEACERAASSSSPSRATSSHHSHPRPSSP